MQIIEKVIPETHTIVKTFKTEAVTTRRPMVPETTTQNINTINREDVIASQILSIL